LLPQPRQTRRRAEFQGFGLLLARNFNRSEKARFGFGVGVGDQFLFLTFDFCALTFDF
jgi:hypothetical protein